MLEDLSGNSQPAFGSQAHWTYLRAVMTDSVVFAPLQAEVIRLVATAIAANPTRPFISSRESGAEALQAVGTTWHAEFPRRFPNIPNGVARGVFGMALWHYLVGHSDRWCFSGIADPYGHGQGSIDYWRLVPRHAKPYSTLKIV